MKKLLVYLMVAVMTLSCLAGCSKSENNQNDITPTTPAATETPAEPTETPATPTPTEVPATPTPTEVPATPTTSPVPTLSPEEIEKV